MKKFALSGMLLAALIAGCGMEDTDELPPNDDDTGMVDDDENVDDNDDDEPTPPLPIADFDNDSVQNPALEQFMSPTGTREIFYSNDLSFPEGDSEDFIEFSLPSNSNSNQRIELTLDCAIDGDEEALVRADIWEDGVESLTKRVLCNDGTASITVDNTKDQTVRIYFLSVAAETYVEYTLHVNAYNLF